MPQESLHFKSNYQIKEFQFLSFPRTINPVSPSLKVPLRVEYKPPKISPPWIGGQFQRLKNKCCVPLGTEIRRLTNTESFMEGPRSRKVQKHTYRGSAIFKWYIWEIQSMYLSRPGYHLLLFFLLHLFVFMSVRVHAHMESEDNLWKLYSPFHHVLLEKELKSPRVRARGRGGKRGEAVGEERRNEREHTCTSKAGHSL